MSKGSMLAGVIHAWRTVWRVMAAGTLVFLGLGACGGNAWAQAGDADSLKRALPGATGVSRIRTLASLAAAMENRHPDSAMVYATEAYRLAGDVKDNEGRITSAYQLGMLYAQARADSQALRYLNQGLAQAVTADVPRLRAEGHLRLSRYYYGVNDYNNSIAQAEACVAIALRHDLSEIAGEAYRRLNSAYKAMGNYKGSLDNSFKALKLYETLHRPDEVARSLNDIGTAYLRTNDLDDALTYFNRALAMNESRHNTRVMTNNITNIGVVHQKAKRHDQALTFYRRALPMARQFGDTLTEAIITGNIGSTLVDQGRLEEGLVYLQQALALKKRGSIPRNVLHTLNDIADVKVKLHDGPGARQTALQVIDMAQRHHEPDQLRYGYLNLSKSYTLTGDYENAYRYLQKHNAINDSLFNIQKAQEIKALQVQYETEKKDMTIAALQQDREMADAQKKIYVLAATVVLLLLAGLYIHQRIKTRRNRVLLEKEREVEQVKSEFFANISHEFRTPLSLILAPIDTLLDSGSAADRFQLGLMKKNATRLLRLINQILDLSRLQSGKLELNVSYFNVVERTRGVTAMFHSMLESKDVALTIDSAEEEIALYGDQERIETVVVNLVANAIKFTGAGGSIHVRLRRLDPGPDFSAGAVELQVADNGIGIDPAHLAHIFDRFYQAGNAGNPHGGTGIGLALCHQLVALHRGTISVGSEPGQGTTVTVRLPLGKDHLGDVAVTASGPGPVGWHVPHPQEPVAPPPAAEAWEETEQPLVLIIDDSADVRSYIRSILQDRYAIVEASQGAAGLAIAQASMPDLVICDVMMPVLNGYDTCRQLKGDQRTSHIPVILLTAKTSIASRVEGLETAADLYLAKPFVPRELLLYVANLIQARRALRERYNRQLVLKPTEVAVNSMDEQFLQRLLQVVEAHYADENFSVEQLSQEMALSRSQLHRKLQALTNESTSQFIRAFRLARAMDLLKKRHASVSEIAFKVGFSNPSYFNKCFLQQYGRTPSSVWQDEEAA